jgi:hypothetical protein
MPTTTSPFPTTALATYIPPSTISSTVPSHPANASMHSLTPPGGLPPLAYTILTLIKEDSTTSTNDGVSFAIYHAFDTWEQAFTHICHFYPHIQVKTDITYMNANCCHNTLNLNNPSPTISHYIGLYPNTSYHHKECFYFDDLPTIDKTS